RESFGVENLLRMGGIVLACPPVRFAFEMGKSGFDNIRKGLEYLGVDLSLESWRARAALRAEKLKNLPLERLTLLQEDLNTKIQEGLQNSKDGAWVKDLSIELKEGVVYLKGKVDLGLMDVDLNGEITFEVKNGNAEGRVVKLEAGGFSLPDMLKEKIIQSLKHYGVDVPKTPNFDDLSWIDVEGLQNLSIRDGEVIIDLRKGARVSRTL